MSSSKGWAERAERRKWLEDLVVRVLVAMRERDTALADADRRVGKALREMTDEDLSVPEPVEWCGDEITTRGDAAASPRRGDGDDRNSTPGTAKGLVWRRRARSRRA